MVQSATTEPYCYDVLHMSSRRTIIIHLRSAKIRMLKELIGSVIGDVAHTGYSICAHYGHGL